MPPFGSYLLVSPNGLTAPIHFVIRWLIESFLVIGVSSAIETRCASKLWMRICPQKLNTLSLIVFWNPLAKASVTIITITLITVAATESLITKREKDFCWLNAIRFAIKPEMFNQKKI